jgi:predicted nucleotidyltransferase component of viral defense system
MINKNEIREISADLGLSLDVIEKDYVLGWLIAGIKADEELKDHWIFKGGICLKKCFLGIIDFQKI